MQVNKQNQANKMSNHGGKRKKQIWDYFIKTGQNAKCSLCEHVLKISQRSTTGLKYHLKSKHFVDLANSQAAEQEPGPSTPQDASLKTDNQLYDDDEPRNKVPKKYTLDNCLKNEHSREVMISRMVAKDGITFNCLSASEDLKYLFTKNGLSLPTCPDTIKTIVENFSMTVKAEMIKTLQNLKIRGEKFSLGFDEWTTITCKRYLNVNVHHLGGTHFNLGLIRIHGSCNVEQCVELVKTRLEAFILHLDTDIVGITTDDASVMKKVGRLLSCYQQLCFAHGIQLAVVNTLYREEVPHTQHKDKLLAACYSDDDDSSEEPDSSYTHFEQPPAELIPNYRGLIDKVRKVVRLFRKSATKEACLQKYAREDLGMDYGLILDCRTKWSTLYDMLERFKVLKGCTTKALIDVGSEITFTEDEWADIKDLLLSLQPLKLGVEVLCRRDSTLLTADTTLRFILEKLDKQQSRVSDDLATALRMRIKERRTDLSGIVLYLHNPKKYEKSVKSPEDTFLLPKKNRIRLELIKICERLLTVKEDTGRAEGDRFDDEEDDSSDEDITLRNELETELRKQKNETCTVIAPTKSQNFEKTIKAEMVEYENKGIKGKHLTLVHKYLNTISPTSVEAERAFSVTGYVCSPIRNKMTDRTLDTICFLRSYFQNNK